MTIISMHFDDVVLVFPIFCKISMNKTIIDIVGK